MPTKVIKIIVRVGFILVQVFGRIAERHGGGNCSGKLFGCVSGSSNQERGSELIYLGFLMQRSSPWVWLCSRRSPRLSHIAFRHRRLLMTNLPSQSHGTDIWASVHSPADWQAVPAADDLPGYAIFKKDIRKPEVDDRDYRYIKLENDLEALLIHDVNADKSAASMDVEIGHTSDPVNRATFPA